MWRTLSPVLVFSLALLTDHSVEGGDPKLHIIVPKEGDRVPERPYVSGRVADATVEVWVIIHPLVVGGYWVQPRPSVRKDGSWKASVYVGRPGSIDIGKGFEMRAVANPREQLAEGEMLASWPEARWESEIMEVFRK